MSVSCSLGSSLGSASTAEDRARELSARTEKRRRKEMVLRLGLLWSRDLLLGGAMAQKMTLVHRRATPDGVPVG